MTLHEVSTQIYNLTSGRVNGEKFTKRELESVLRMWMRTADHNKISGSVAIWLTLGDGEWLSTVDKFSDAPDGYDYYIPDTREQEKRILEALTA